MSEDKPFRGPIAARVIATIDVLAAHPDGLDKATLTLLANVADVLRDTYNSVRCIHEQVHAMNERLEALEKRGDQPHNHKWD